MIHAQSPVRGRKSVFGVGESQRKLQLHLRCQGLKGVAVDRLHNIMQRKLHDGKNC